MIIKRIPLFLLVLLAGPIPGFAATDHKADGRRRIEEAVKLFQGCENRFTGSAGNRAFSKKIGEEFKSSGLPCGTSEYELPVFVPGEAWLTVAGRRLRLNTFLPNVVELCRFPEKKFSGKLYYLGSGERKNLDGKDLRGSLCLFDFDCQMNYLEVMKFGARGCLFIEPEVYSPFHAYQKVLNVPLTIPRYQLSRADGEFLKSLAAGAAGVAFAVEVVRPNRWEMQALRNHWVLVEGQDPTRRKEMIILYANLDSMHYCPELASGGEEALNLKLLLDLFAQYRQAPPQRSLLFMVFNSLHQNHTGAAEAVFHLFGVEHEIFNVKEGTPSEERTVQVQKTENEYLIKKYMSLAPDVITQDIIEKMRDLREKPAGRQLEPAGAFLRLVELRVFQLRKEKERLLRKGLPEDTSAQTELSQQIKQLGPLVSVFKRFGRILMYKQLTASQKELFEQYRQEVMINLRNDLERANLQQKRLANIWQARTILGKYRPLLALGISLSYGNRWLALDRGDTPRRSWGDVADLPRTWSQITRDLTDLFRNRVSTLADEIVGEYGLAWQAKKLRNPTAPPRASVQFMFQTIPAFEVVSAFSGNQNILSSADRLENLDPEIVSRKTVFTKWLIARIMEDEETTSNLSRGPAGAKVSRIRHRAGGSGRLVTRVQDGSSLAGPTTVLPQALIVLPFFRPSNKISALSGGIWAMRMLMADAGGHAFFYNLPYALNFWPESYHLDAAGRIDHAIDYGLAADKFVTQLNISEGFLQHHLLASVKCRKADSYDLVHPKTLRPVGAPFLQKPGGGVVHRFSVAGFAFEEKKVNIPERPAPNKGKARGHGIACIFAEDDMHIQVLFSGDLNLTKITPAAPLEGEGYLISELDRQSAIVLATQDAIALNRKRIQLLNDNAVTNDLMTRFHRRSERYLKGTEAGLKSLAALAEENAHTELASQRMQAYGSGFGAYPIVNATISDMMKAVVFYLAVLLPFSFFLQRLLFSFTRVEAQIASFAGIFITVYIVFHFIHPAFKIADNPGVILISFIMLVLGGFVTFALKGKFDYHMEAIKERFTSEEEVSVMKLVGTAMLIGVSNMKRRRLRTALTCVTIILITFTMLSFTSVSQSLAPTLIKKEKPAAAPYNGIFFSRQTWQGLERQKVDMLTQILAKDGEYLQRCFRTYPPEDPAVLIPAASPQKHIDIFGILGLQQGENGWLGKMPVVAGRFFSSDKALEIMVTDEFARATLELDYTPGENPLSRETWLTLNGVRLKLVGILASERLAARHDLRGASILPQERAQKGAFGSSGGMDDISEDDEVAEGTFKDVSPQYFVVIPFDIRDRLDIPVVSVSIKLASAQKVWDRIMEYVYYSTDKVYFGATKQFILNTERDQEKNEPLYQEPGRYYLGSGFSTSIGGLSSLIIPLLISATIIFNTMLGAVYERKKEIAIYNAIGLNPIHIAMFFVAEAVVYGILGGVGGYLIGQVLANILVALDLFGDMNLNYSSLTVVYVILFTILIVVLSTIYPAVMAMRTASSSSGRKRIEKRGPNNLAVSFPYSFTREMAVAVNSYLKEYFDKHADSSLGHFEATPVSCTREDREGELALVLQYDVALAPYDLGVTQRVVLTTTYNETVGAFMIHAETERFSGQDSNWLATNRPFLNGIRKYLLHWRVLSREGQQAHMEQGMELFDLTT